MDMQDWVADKVGQPGHLLGKGKTQKGPLTFIFIY